MRNLWDFYSALAFTVVAILLCIFLAGINGCTSKLTYVNIDLESEAECEQAAVPGVPSKCISINVLNLKADGAVFDTDTDQTTDGQVPVSLYGANSATGGQTTPVANFTPLINEVLDVGKEKIKKIISDKEKVKVPIIEPIIEPQPIILRNKEIGDYRGRTNGNRPTWYFNKKMGDYPAQFTVVIKGAKCDDLAVQNNGERYEKDLPYLVKQSDVPGRGMAVLASADCSPSEAAYVLY